MTAEPPTGLEAKLDGILVHMVSGLTASLAASVGNRTAWVGMKALRMVVFDGRGAYLPLRALAR
jgi:hypothetical protein